VAAEGPSGLKFCPAGTDVPESGVRTFASALSGRLQMARTVEQRNLLRWAERGTA
jgi:hypothetical protein